MKILVVQNVEYDRDDITAWAREQLLVVFERFISPQLKKIKQSHGAIIVRSTEQSSRESEHYLSILINQQSTPTYRKQFDTRYAIEPPYPYFISEMLHRASNDTELNIADDDILLVIGADRNGIQEILLSAQTKGYQLPHQKDPHPYNMTVLEIDTERTIVRKFSILYGAPKDQAMRELIDKTATTT